MKVYVYSLASLPREENEPSGLCYERTLYPEPHGKAKRLVITEKMLKEFGLENVDRVGGGITGKWKYRIIIPLYMNGKLVSWTGRSILSKEKLKENNIPRYKNLSVEESVIDAKRVIYNLDNCVGKTVVLTEGPMDVLRFDGNCVCSFGTSMTQEQIKIIAGRFNKVYVLFDNEVEAQHKARNYGMQLSALGVDVEVIDAFSDFGKNDMGELTPDELEIIKKELGI